MVPWHWFVWRRKVQDIKGVMPLKGGVSFKGIAQESKGIFASSSNA